MTFTTLTDQLFRFLVTQTLDPLLSFEMEFDPVAFVISTDQTVGMAAVTVHVPVGERNSPVAHGNGHLMQCLRKQSPEIPVIFGTA